MFAHTNLISSREDPFGLNLGGVYYESVTSPFFILENLFRYTLSYLIHATDMFRLSLFQIVVMVRVEILLSVGLKTVGVLFRIKLKQFFIKILLLFAIESL